MITLRSKLDYIYRFLLTLTYFCTSLPTASLILFYTSFLGHSHPFTKKTRALFSVCTCAPWLLCAGVRLAIANEELVYSHQEGSCTINVGTHASHIDGLAMMVAYWRNRWRITPPCSIVKREVLLTPLYGFFAFLVGNVFVARGRDSNRDAAKRSMDQVAGRLKNGYVVGAFPEGSRRRTPSCGKSHLLPFKKGIFHLVYDLFQDNFPVTIAPFFLVGSHSAWPTGRLVPISGTKVLLYFCRHKEVTKEDTVDSLLSSSRSIIEDTMESVVRDDAGKYSVDGAFEKGKEVNLVEEFLVEAILLTIPTVSTLVCFLMGVI
jgi:1-acyl-sn-glycerol-3-phosphate acyltransferase